MDKIVVNLKIGNSKTVIEDGVEYRVAPATLIVEGVLPGSDGPLLYPAGEISKGANAWNDILVTNGHPKANGRFVSVLNDAQTIEEFAIGVVKNPQFVQNKLLAELWIDVAKARQINNQILTMIDTGRPIDLSTGLFSDKLSVNGDFNGERYSGIATNHRPDHLAILTNERGACSLEDGCGVLVNKRTDGTETPITFHLTNNEMSHEELHSMLRNGLRKRFTQNEAPAFIESVFNNRMIFEQNGELFSLNFTMNGNDVSLSDDSPQRVVRQTDFVPVTNTEEKPNMADNNKSKLVDSIIANEASIFTADHRDFLNGLDDGGLAKLASQQPTAKAEPKAPAEPVTNNMPTNNCGCDGETKVTPTAPTNNTISIENLQKGLSQLSETQWLQIMPENFQNMIRNSAKIEAEHKEQLMSKITVNMDDEQRAAFIERNKEATKEQLEEMLLVANANQAAQPQNVSPLPRPNYMGAGGVNNQTEPADDEVLQVPVMNFAGVKPADNSNNPFAS